jgi:hypothetical protein
MNKNILLLSLIFFTLSANAVTRTWDGGGNGVTWEDPLNWDTNTLPCTTCDVVIYYAGVTLNSSVTVNSLLIGQKVYPYNTGGLSISSGATLTASNSGGIGVEVYFNSILSLAGTLNVSGSLTGLLNEGDANFLTSLGSSVTISNTTGYGFVNNGNSALQGDMNITNCGAGITNSKTLSISGDVIIDNVTGSGLVNLIDSFGGLSELTINSGGKLSINESDDYGIYTRTKIYNNGEISIENAGTYGISFDSPILGP